MLHNVKKRNVKNLIFSWLVNFWVSLTLILSTIFPSIVIAYDNQPEAKVSTIQQSQLQVINDKYAIEDENKSWKIQKEITNFDANAGEATIRLSFTHYPSDETAVEYADTPEIYILVDENMSTWDNFDDWIALITSFCENILKRNSRTQIGFIGIQGPIKDLTPNPDGSGNIIYGPNDQHAVEGSSDNAEVIVPLTNNLDEIRFGFSNMNLSKTQYYTNLQAGIELACQDELYSGTKSKLLISLCDVAPLTANGLSASISFNQGEDPNPYYVAYYETMTQKTGPAITNLANYNIDLIMVRPSNTSYNYSWYDPDRNSY